MAFKSSQHENEKVASVGITEKLLKDCLPFICYMFIYLVETCSFVLEKCPVFSLTLSWVKCSTPPAPVLQCTFK